MEFKYNLSRNDYKKIIQEQNAKTNIICIIFASLFFLVLSIPFLIDNTLLIFILYLIYMGILLLILFILNKVLTNIIVKLNEKNLNIKYGIYKIKVEKDKIVEELEDFKCEIKFNDIRKVKYHKNMIKIYLYSKPIALILKKDLFDDINKFEKIEKVLKEKVIITK